jgi:hypothetical protein
MLHSFVHFASEVAGEESSKTAFYIFGGVLALYAFAISALGISRHRSFPGSDGAARGVMALTVVLVAAAMATSIITA